MKAIDAIAAHRETRKLAQEEAEEIGSEYDMKRVWLIEDGERHWYVAEDAGKALSAHISLMEAEADTFTVKEVQPWTKVTVTMETAGDCLGFPDAFQIVGPHEGCDDEASDFGVRATAAQWAEHYDNGDQVASSAFL